ncbi:MAG: S-methyl-5'-thioinosine phosphorylase [Aggregatilineales bacterium]
MVEQVKIAVIGGSGLYNIPELTDISRHSIDTPFGKPSGDIVIGTLRGKRVAFLPRHGEGHTIAPAFIPQRANIYALKTLGVRFCIAVNACGSLREDFAPGHIAIPDQLFDYTIGTRERSFFTTGVVAHVSVADSFDDYLRKVLVTAVEQTGETVHDGGNFLIEDGPRFATKSESHIFRQWGCDLIGMTSAPEAFLAREAEIAYAAMAHITDYDSWHVSEAPVTSDAVRATFETNIVIVRKALAHTIENLQQDTVNTSHTALDAALGSNPDYIPDEKLEELHPILARVLKLNS